jgi:3-oxoacyl-[acyl-carrier protein] reductase
LEVDSAGGAKCILILGTLMLNQPTAIVTGASRGIGRAIALKFAKEGIAVALIGRDESALQETANLIENGNAQPTLQIQADLRNAQQVKSIVNITIAEWGRIDVLVNNAGIMYQKPFEELDQNEIQEMLDVNLRAVIILTQEALPHIRKQENGAIINIASLAGKNPVKNGTVYAATKWALRGFAASLMLEVRQDDIRVVTIFPGSVDTDLNRQSALRRDTMMQAEDVAHAVYSSLVVDRRTMMSEIDLRPTNPQKD